MLLGRERERLAIENALAGARSGGSTVIALVGEPGIGKTALLDDAAQRAAEISGMQLLRARGVESEAHIPFGSLLELLRPALVMLEKVPEPQAVALGGALALRPAPAQDRFAIGSATSRRNANSSAWALDSSSHCASSISTATGPGSA